MATLGATGLAALGAAPANAAVAPGHSLLTMHNLDFIAASGYAVGDPLTISVDRPGVGIIGSITAPALEGAEGVGLELNHGPAGTPVAGDCWTDAVPDMLPGDTIRVGYTGGEDSIVIDDIDILVAPYLVGQDVVVEGIARDGAGSPIPLEALDSGEVRNPTSRVRATPTKVERIAGTTDRWRATYEANPANGAAAYGVFRNDNGVNTAAVRQAILTGDHAMGYGHPVVPAPPVIQLVDGIGGGGPALGCPTIPYERNSIEGANRTAINIANQTTPLVINGLAASDVTAANHVRIKVNGEPVDATVAVSAAGTWTASIAPDQLAVADGTMTVEADFPNSKYDTIDGARITMLELIKDTVAPGAPTADLPADSYEGTRNVTLAAENGATIRYTNNGSAPTTASAVAKGPIAVTASQTLRAIAYDAAGNPSPMTTLAYMITEERPQAEASGVAGVGASGTTVVVGRADDASSAAAAAGSTSTQAAPLTLAGLATTKSITAKAVRKSGLRVIMNIKKGTNVVRLRVYRKNANGTKTLISQGFRSPAVSGLYRVRLQDPKLRVALKAGLYELEVTPGTSRTETGKAGRFAFTVRSR